MRRLNADGPMDYGFCNQTVTLYHPDFSDGFRCRRTVFAGAYWDSREMGEVNGAQQSRMRRCFLLLPCRKGGLQWRPEGQAVALDQEQWFSLVPGDRVMLGEGPQITDAKQWAAFTPGRTCSLAVIKEVAAKAWQGKICHVEAQTEWYKQW